MIVGEIQQNRTAATSGDSVDDLGSIHSVCLAVNSERERIPKVVFG